MNRINLSPPLSLKTVFVVLAALLCLSALAVAAHVRRAADPAGRPAPADASPSVQQAGRSRGRSLALQPEAFKLGLRLGRRFREAGREVSVLSGKLTLGGESRAVVIRRVRGEEGESLEIALADAAPYTWDERGGVRQSGRAEEGEKRLMVERLALDSPDQFVLAQTRGASYYTVARRVRADEGGSDGYAGPLYDLVRVDEPRGEGVASPVSPWRIYHLNSDTGLPGKVSYEEDGGKIEVTISGWAEHDGELQPSRISWTRESRPLMELTLTNVSHGPKQ